MSDLTAEQAGPRTGTPSGPRTGPQGHDELPLLPPRSSRTLLVLVSTTLLVAAGLLLGSALVTGV